MENLYFYISSYFLITIKHVNDYPNSYLALVVNFQWLYITVDYSCLFQKTWLFFLCSVMD